MDWRKMQVTFSWKPILLCAGLNLLAAGIVFLGSFLLTGSVITTVFNTMFGWFITLTVSVLYWIWWFFENIRNVPEKIKAAFTAVMLFLLVLDWIIIFEFLSLIS
jgi:hypothetical protein